MSWARRFGFRQWLHGSLWVLPLLGGILGVVLGIVDVVVDESIHLPDALTYSSSTASTILSAIVGAMAALTGFVVTVTVLVVQMATGSFSARYMRLWYRDRMLKATLALLIGTLAFSFVLLRRVDSTFVPNLGVSIAGLLVIVSLLVFVVFLDRYLHRLRPVAVTVLVAGYIQRDFKRFFEALMSAPDVFSGSFDPAGEQPSLVVRSSGPGAIQAIDAHGLVQWTRRHGCLVVAHHTVGDFVPAGAELLEAYGGHDLDQRSEGQLRGMIALGVERTIEQDPAFAIRIMVDIADKALSTSVNDPTTAVQVLDHLGDVLRVIGETDLAISPWSGPRGDRAGVVVRVRSWEDYLTLGTTEIREYGAGSIQVVRRLRAMLEELSEQVRAEHRPAVEEELARLEETVARSFGGTVDLDRARVADDQGIGGRTAPARPNRVTP